MPYFCQKMEKRSQNLSSAAVVIGAFRVKQFISTKCMHTFVQLLTNAQCESGNERIPYLT